MIPITEIGEFISTMSVSFSCLWTIIWTFFCVKFMCEVMSTYRFDRSMHNQVIEFARCIFLEEREGFILLIRGFWWPGMVDGRKRYRAVWLGRVKGKKKKVKRGVWDMGGYIWTGDWWGCVGRSGRWGQALVKLGGRVLKLSFLWKREVGKGGNGGVEDGWWLCGGLVTCAAYERV